MYNLKPCPFCGSEAVFVTFNRMDGQCSYKCGAVCCSDCACRTSEYVIDGYLGIETTKDDIVAIWNSRVNDEAD